MHHGQIGPASEMPGVTSDARERLGRIVNSIDSRFMQVGTMLGGAVEAIDGIVGALGQVATVFRSGDAATAVDNLSETADRLSAVSGEVELRAGEVARIHSASARMSKHVGEVQKTLEILQIYSMNVKIAASGTPAFVDFADRMTSQLRAGEKETKGFEIRLRELHASLARSEPLDKALMAECARVLPDVPNRLIADARALRQHQDKLAALAEGTTSIARSIQGNVAIVLGALQIGDIARQRLEHVLHGCTLLDAHLADSANGHEADDGTRRHILALMVAQLVETSAEFQRETQSLILSLRAIQPEAQRLISLHEREGTDQGHIFLRRLESGIADAASMVAQLRLADAQAEEMLRTIVDSVDELSARAAAIRSLRIDVQQMAINIGLRCRRVEAIGKPVTVIADEIRSYSDKLDAIMGPISEAADELKTISLRMREQMAGRADSDDDKLARSLNAIRDGALSTEASLSIAEKKADGLIDMLQRTTDELGQSLDLGGTIDAIVQSLRDNMDGGKPMEDRPDHPVRLLMAEIGRSYTMVSERVIHDRFLLPGMAPTQSSAPSPRGEAVAPVSLDDDDDALFDDALF